MYFFISYTVQIFITMRTAVERKQQQQMAIFGGLFKAFKGEKAVAKPLKEKPTYSKK